jgi:hypothetical protein
MDYENGKIYCISNDNLYYVGSTARTLKDRLRGHRTDYFQYLDDKQHYKSSYEIIKTGVHQIKLIENYPCESKAELEKREYEIIKQYKELHGDKCVNIAGVLPKQTQDEYYQKARDRANTYYAEHKEECNEKMRQSYYDNREKRLEQVKKYREDNHEKIMEKLLTPTECECGDVVAKCNLTRHKKSKRHLDKIKKEII